MFLSTIKTVMELEILCSKNKHFICVILLLAKPANVNFMNELKSC